MGPLHCDERTIHLIAGNTYIYIRVTIQTCLLFKNIQVWSFPKLQTIEFGFMQGIFVHMYDRNLTFNHFKNSSPNELRWLI